MSQSTAGGRADTARRSPSTTATAVVASLTALLLAAPPPRAAVRELAGAASSSDPTAPVVAAVALAAWAVSGWLALTVAVVLLSRLPGLVGRAGRAVAVRIAPATVRRAVEAALGLTVVVGALAPPAALAAAAPGPAAATVAGPGTEQVWDLDWPSSSAAPPSAAPPSAAPVRTSPATARPGSAPPSVTPAPAPAAAAQRAAATTPPAVVRHSPTAPSAASVVVRPGDSLWSIAETSLRRTGAQPSDRQVALAWPRWWAANREAVGDDPDLLLPGTVLRPPPHGAS